MRRTPAFWRAGLAAGAALALAAAPVRAVEPAQWVLKSKGLWVSDRTFAMALSVKKKDLKKEDAPRRAAEQLQRLRERLVLAVAAVDAGLDQDPAVRAELDAFRWSHLADMYLDAKVVGPARRAAREKAAQPGQKPGVEAATFKEERTRLLKQVTADAVKALPAEVDEANLAAAAKGEGGDAVVARVAGQQVTRAWVIGGMAQVDHPSDDPATALRVARTVMDGGLDRIRFAALAEKEGFTKKPDFVDNLADRALRLFAEAYVAKKVNPGVQVAEADVAAEYERTRESSRRGEEREIYEILVPTRAEAEAIAARLAKGADFAAEVAAHSVAPTKAKGGFLGFIQAGESIPAIDQAITALQPGQVSPVVQSPFGFHLLRCKSVQTGRIPPLEEARPALEQRLLGERRAKAVAEAVVRLEQQAPVEINQVRYEEILKSL